MVTQGQMHSEMLYLLGQLLGPLESLSSDTADPAHRRLALAQYAADLNVFQERFRTFTHPPGHAYTHEFTTGFRALYRLAAQGATLTGNSAQYRETVARTAATVRDAICAVPMVAEATILTARSPFSAYCFIRDLCETTSMRLVWIDRYLSSAVFYRYLRHLPPSAGITLVTWPESKYTKSAWLDFVETSRLFAAERGPGNYTLFSKIDFHDRWLSCDGALYLLGGSGKDAGQTSDFSVSPMEATPETLDRFAAASTGAIELFGSSTPNHP